MVDDCLVTFEKFQKQYIIIPSLSLNPLLIEEKPFIIVRSPPGFFNPEKETRCYLNAIFQNLYYNVLFRELLFKINWYTMLNDLVSGSQYFVHNFQKFMIFRELQKKFGEIYLGGKKNHIYWYVLHCGKYHNQLSDGCQWIRGDDIYYAVH